MTYTTRPAGIPQVTGSAAAHAERIARNEEARTTARSSTGGKQTFEIYAERAAAGARADEELRIAARRREMIARGVIVDDEDPEDYDEDDEDAEPRPEPKKTVAQLHVERYYARESIGRR